MCIQGCHTSVIIVKRKNTEAYYLSKTVTTLEIPVFRIKLDQPEEAITAELQINNDGGPGAT